MISERITLSLSIRSGELSALCNVQAAKELHAPLSSSGDDRLQISQVSCGYPGHLQRHRPDGRIACGRSVPFMMGCSFARPTISFAPHHEDFPWRGLNSCHGGSRTSILLRFDLH